MRIWDVEAWKRQITIAQLRRWIAFYRQEPWGQPWRIAGRAVSLIRAALGVKYDKADETRFLVTYREGDEHNVGPLPSQAEVARKLASIPGMKKRAK